MTDTQNTQGNLVVLHDAMNSYAKTLLTKVHEMEAIVQRLAATLKEKPSEIPLLLNILDEMTLLSFNLAVEAAYARQHRRSFTTMETWLSMLVRRVERSSQHIDQLQKLIADVAIERLYELLRDIKLLLFQASSIFGPASTHDLSTLADSDPTLPQRRITSGPPPGISERRSANRPWSNPNSNKGGTV